MHEYDQYILDKAEKCCNTGDFDRSLYDKYDVKMGLRDRDGKGVVAGLTNISRVTGFETVDGKVVPCRGKLVYRGYSVEDLINSQKGEKGLFEKCSYLLLFNEIPSEEELATFTKYLNKQMSLPANFVKEVILRENGSDLMNTMSRCVMNLAMYDHHVADMSPAKALKNCMKLIATMPLFAVYGYQAYNHFDMGGNLHIVKPKPELTVAENILRMLRPGKGYTDLEAIVLDRLLVLHLEHGGGNNSTFTARVVSSAGSDTYAVIVAALMSLKGPKHGGANLKVSSMAEDIRAHVKHPEDPDKLSAYLRKIACGGGRPHGRFHDVPQHRTSGTGHHQGEAHRGTHLRQRGPLQRIHLRTPRIPQGPVHAHVRRGQDRGMVRPPHGRDHLLQQDHPSRLRQHRQAHRDGLNSEKKWKVEPLEGFEPPTR